MGGVVIENDGAMLDLDFTGARALVTGGSRGIGQAIAMTLLRGGASVAITSTSSAPGWAVGNANVAHHSLDFTADDSITSFLDRIDEFGPFDIVINNAGVHAPEPVDEITREAWERIFRVNLYGPMVLIRHFAGGMKAARSGWIVNVASIAGTVCREQAVAYSSSKLGLIGLTRSCAIDLAPYGVLVNAVSPGTTQTDMVDKILSPERRQSFLNGVPLRRFANPQEVANVVAFLASRWNTYMTGQNVIVDGGTTIA